MSDAFQIRDDSQEFSPQESAVLVEGTVAEVVCVRRNQAPAAMATETTGNSFSLVSLFLASGLLALILCVWRWSPLLGILNAFWMCPAYGRTVYVSQAWQRAGHHLSWKRKLDLFNRSLVLMFIAEATGIAFVIFCLPLLFFVSPGILTTPEPAFPGMFLIGLGACAYTLYCYRPSVYDGPGGNL